MSEKAINEIEILHFKYKTLVDYANERQEHHIQKALEADSKYRATGNITYYQEAENQKSMSSRLCAEARAYRVFKKELEGVLEHESVK